MLDLRPSDTYWCTADPGWVTGTSYGIVAPLVIGATSIVDAAEFDAHRWYDILERERVQVWYTAPTAIRRLMRAAQPRPKHDLTSLRRVASVGEPLNPEAVEWGFRVRPHDPRHLVADRDRLHDDRELRARAPSGPARWGSPCPASRRPSWFGATTAGRGSTTAT